VWIQNSYWIQSTNNRDASFYIIIEISAQKAFYKDFISFVSPSIHSGYSLVICIDVNKNMELGYLTQSFRILGLVNSIFQITTDPCPPSYIVGSS
jgi:hypothetical protein